MREVSTLVAYLAVGLGNGFDRFLAPMTPALFRTQGFLQLLELLLVCAVMAWVKARGLTAQS